MLSQFPYCCHEERHSSASLQEPSPIQSTAVTSRILMMHFQVLAVLSLAARSLTLADLPSGVCMALQVVSW